MSFGMKKSKLFLGFMGPLKCTICGRKCPKPVIFLSGKRFCSSCARFTLNFSHNVSQMFTADDLSQRSHEGGD